MRAARVALHNCLVLRRRVSLGTPQARPPRRLGRLRRAAHAEPHGMQRADAHPRAPRATNRRQLVVVVVVVVVVLLLLIIIMIIIIIVIAIVMIVILIIIIIIMMTMIMIITICMSCSNRQTAITTY